jgi:hypothetical protein
MRGDGSDSEKHRREALLMRGDHKQTPRQGRAPSGVIGAQLAGSNTCTALHVTVRAKAPVLALCRALVAQGVDPSIPLEARRSMLCLRVTSIGAAAQLEVNAKGTGFAPSRAVRTAPPARVQPPPSSPAHTNGEVIATRRATQARAETERKQRLAGDTTS